MDEVRGPFVTLDRTWSQQRKVVPGFFRVTCVGRSATDEAAANRIRRVRIEVGKSCRGSSTLDFSCRRLTEWQPSRCRRL
jgi:hypothetical protein